MADTKNDAARVDARRDPNNPVLSVNTMDRAEADKAVADQKKANKEAAERATEPAPPPTPSQEELDAMKEGEAAAEPAPAPVSRREAKADSSDRTDYKTR